MRSWMTAGSASVCPNDREPPDGPARAESTTRAPAADSSWQRAHGRAGLHSFRASSWAAACAQTSWPTLVSGLELTAIDQPQAAGRVLATCRHVRARVAPVVPSRGSSAPIVVQVVIMSAHRSPAPGGPRGVRRGCLELAAAHGWVELLPGLVAHGERWTDEATRQAALNNRPRVLEWVRVRLPACWGSAHTATGAAEGGHLGLLQWARAQTPPAPWDHRTCSTAALGGHLALLRWARAQSPPAPWDTRTCSGAAGGGHLELLQWARAHGAPWDEATCSSAALSGHLEVLQWARAQAAPWCPWTCFEAARGGHLELLRWARRESPPAPWDAGTCSAAAFGGHLELLQWARAQGAPWDEATCNYAAEAGHLEVLQWARAQGAPWSEWTVAAAVRGGHPELLRWARAHDAVQCAPR